VEDFILVLQQFNELRQVQGQEHNLLQDLLHAQEPQRVQARELKQRHGLFQDIEQRQVQEQEHSPLRV
jgi:hypothetical protein